MSKDDSEFDNMFLDALLPLQRGTLLERAEGEILGLVNSVDALQKTGTITLKVTIKPEGQGQLSISGEVVTKLPTPVVRPAAFFITPDGNLSSNDPQQAHMGDVVDGFKVKEKPVVSYDPKTGEVKE